LTDFQSLRREYRAAVSRLLGAGRLRFAIKKNMKRLLNLLQGEALCEYTSSNIRSQNGIKKFESVLTTRSSPASRHKNSRQANDKEDAGRPLIGSLKGRHQIITPRTRTSCVRRRLMANVSVSGFGFALALVMVSPRFAQDAVFNENVAEGCDVQA